MKDKEEEEEEKKTANVHNRGLTIIGLIVNSYRGISKHCLESNKKPRVLKTCSFL
jgi:hypothetical protein